MSLVQFDLANVVSLLNLKMMRILSRLVWMNDFFTQFSNRDFLVPLFAQERNQWINECAEVVYRNYFCVTKVDLHINQLVEAVGFSVNALLAMAICNENRIKFSALSIDCNGRGMWFINPKCYSESYWT